MSSVPAQCLRNSDNLKPVRSRRSQIQRAAEPDTGNIAAGGSPGSGTLPDGYPSTSMTSLTRSTR